jgi:hypothetical protein
MTELLAWLVATLITLALIAGFIAAVVKIDERLRRRMRAHRSPPPPNRLR